MPVFYVAWMMAQTADPSPTALFTQLGAFGAALAVGAVAYRDKSKQCDRLLAAVEQQTPILIENRDTMRSALSTIEANTTAMRAMSEALKRCPTETEITRLRIMLEDAENRDRRRRTSS
jgi:hypothetical protein